MIFLCPICGYDKLYSPPQDDLICPCCGTHFGYDDYAHTPDELRSAWLDKGAVWFSRHTQKPFYWSPVDQLRTIGYVCTQADLQKINLSAPASLEVAA